jgi:hypothetical protein
MPHDEDTMTPANGWHGLIASKPHLSQDASRRLRDIGFVVMPGPVIGDLEQLSAAYDRAVAAADPGHLHTGRTGSSTRIDDFVNRGSEFDGIYIYPPLLTACCQIIGAHLSSSAACGREHSILARRQSGFMWTSSTEPMGGH